MDDLTRRGFFGHSFAAGSFAALAAGVDSSSAAAETIGAPPSAFTDTHVYVSSWPARRVFGDSTADLVTSLRGHGVREAWTGSFDALLFKDIAAVNARLVEDCEKKGQGILLPFGAINPVLPDWEEDVRRCHEEYRMAGVRVHPNYHGYALDDPLFLRLLERATEANLIVQLVAWMEDERTQDPLLQVPMVDLTPLPGLMRKVPRARVHVSNGVINVSSAERALRPFRGLNRLTFDIAVLENLMGVERLKNIVGAELIAFGSYSPMFYFESTALKLEESVLTPEEMQAIQSGNAARLRMNEAATN